MSLQLESDHWELAHATGAAKKKPCTVMKLPMSPQELMFTSQQLLLTSCFSSLESLSSGMSFLHQQNLPQCVQLHQW